MNLLLQLNQNWFIFLQLCLFDTERNISLNQQMSIATSLISISKASAELYLSEGLEGTIDTFKGNGDSMLKGRSLFQKLELIFQFSPAFLTTLAFRVSCLSIITVFFGFEGFLLQHPSLLWIGVIEAIRTGINFIVAFYFFSHNNRKDRLRNAIHYPTLLILARSYFDSRKESHPKMMAVHMMSTIHYSICLAVTMTWFTILDPSTHLPRWSDHRFFFHDKPGLLVAIISLTFLLGLISIVFVWRLKHQVKTFAMKEGKMESYWGVDSRQPVLNTIAKIQPTDSHFADY